MVHWLWCGLEIELFIDPASYQQSCNLLKTNEACFHLLLITQSNLVSRLEPEYQNDTTTAGRHTCKRKRIPAHGRAAWTGSYWIAVSPICLNLSTHSRILSARSRRLMTLAPTLNLHFSCSHFSRLFLVASNTASRWSWVSSCGGENALLSLSDSPLNACSHNGGSTSGLGNDIGRLGDELSCSG